MQSSLTEKAPSTFRYRPLVPPRRSIRLIRISHTLDEGPVSCKLVQSTYPNADYIALSYQWGSLVDRKPISINGQQLLVTRNLHDFLATAQKSVNTPWLWIDAICIDQSNIPERGDQVRRMGDIFAAAREVWVWLGKLTVPESTLSFTDVFNLATITGVKESDFRTRARIRLQELRNRNDETWVRLLARVCNHDYWDRLWVTQEFIKARSVKILVGDEYIDGEHLRDFMTCIKHSMYTYPPAGVRKLVQRSGAHALWQSRSLWNNEQGERDDPISYRKLTTMLMTHILKKCSDWHDKVYGLISLVDDGDKFPVHYRKGGIELLVDVFQAQGNDAWPFKWAIGFVLKIFLHVPYSDFNVQHDNSRANIETSMAPEKKIPLVRYAIMNDSVEDCSRCFTVTEERAATAGSKLRNGKIQMCPCSDCAKPSFISPIVSPQPGDEIYKLDAFKLTAKFEFRTYLVLRPSHNSNFAYEYVGAMTQNIWEHQMHFHCLSHTFNRFKLEHHLHHSSEHLYLAFNPQTLCFLVENLAVTTVEDGDYFTVRYAFTWNHDTPNSRPPESRRWMTVLTRAASQDVMDKNVHDEARGVIAKIIEILNQKHKSEC
ncbi:MAG: hypothetical protein L6R41_004352 [Letrouitia leprolyta]|nr:MAG: hypothetical protein L6R41_004352 [Letrouitia leprolyta]